MGIWVAEIVEEDVIEASLSDVDHVEAEILDDFPIVAELLDEEMRLVEMPMGEDADVEFLVTLKGAAYDLTGSTLYHRWKESYDDPAATLALSSSDASEIEIYPQSGETLGMAVLHFDGAETALLDQDRYLWDLWIELADGTRRCLLRPKKVLLRQYVTTW